MNFLRAAQETNGAQAEAVSLHTKLGCFANAGMIGQPEVIVGRQHDDIGTIDTDGAPLLAIKGHFILISLGLFLIWSIHSARLHTIELCQAYVSFVGIS